MSRAVKNGLTFYPSSHRYKLDGAWVPGVTTILGVLDKPAIPKWAAKTVAEYVADNPNGIDELRAMGRNPMVHALKEIPWQQRDTAAGRGTILHDYAEQLLSGEEVEIAPEHDEHWDTIQSAVAFMDEWHIEPILIEAAVGSREHKWAGKLDLIAKYRRPDTGHTGVAVMDWKSGKAIYPEYALQLAAYAHAEFQGEDGDEHPLPACDAAFGVHIRSDGYDVLPFTFGPDIYDEFLQVCQVYDNTKRMRGDWKSPGSGYVGLAIQPATTLGASS